MSQHIYFLSKFSDEYEFLQSRLRYYHDCPEKYGFTIHHYIIVENFYWSGLKNHINLDFLRMLDSKFKNFNFTIINHQINDIICLSRRCREEMANCILSDQCACLHSVDDSLYIFSDLDEITCYESLRTLSSYHMLIPSSHYTLPIFLEQFSCWFTTSTLYDEKWHGPVAFLAKPPSSISTLVQTTRHLPDKRTYVVHNSGVHISYLKSTIKSKINNSHGLRFFKIRLFLSLIGIHPFRRTTPRIMNFSSDIKSLLNYFTHLSFSYHDFKSFIFRSIK